MISSDPRSILTNCARRWPARQPLRPRQTAADSGTGEGGESTDEASTAARGSRREHGLGRDAAVDVSTRARAARGARSAAQQTAADYGTGEGGKSTDEARARAARAQTRRARAARGSRREHGLGRHAAGAFHDASAGKGMRGWAHAQPRNAGKGMRGWAHAQPRNVIVSAVCVSDCAVAPCSPPGVGYCARAAHIAQRQLRYSHGTAVPTRHYRELFITKNSSLRISLKYKSMQ